MVCNPHRFGQTITTQGRNDLNGITQTHTIANRDENRFWNRRRAEAHSNDFAIVPNIHLRFKRPYAWTVRLLCCSASLKTRLHAWISEQTSHAPLGALDGLPDTMNDSPQNMFLPTPIVGQSNSSPTTHAEPQCRGWRRPCPSTRITSGNSSMWVCFSLVSRER